MKRKKTFLLSLVFLVVFAGCVFYFGDYIKPRKIVTAQDSQKNGVIFRDVFRASPNDFYTVINGGRIFDSSGKKVYRFPHTMDHFFNDGSVLSADENGIQYFDPQAANIWSRDESVHHDMYVSPDESEIFLLAHYKSKDPKNVDHRVLGLSRQGKQIFNWSAIEHRKELEKILGQPLRQAHTRQGDYEYLHLNSVQALPPNPLEKLDSAFRHGNILINCFMTNLAIIIDRETGKIVWSYIFFHRHNSPDNLSMGVHTIKMLASGEMLYLRNSLLRGEQPNEIEFSTIERLDPLGKKVVWRFEANPPLSFFTPDQGVVELLPNGHLLITNSTHQTSFELDNSNNVVWEWRSPRSKEFPSFRLSRIAKSRLDPIIKVWKAVK